MNNLAGDVIKKQAQRQKDEDNALTKYEMEREFRLRNEELMKQQRDR